MKCQAIFSLKTKAAIESHQLQFCAYGKIICHLLSFILTGNKNEPQNKLISSFQGFYFVAVVQIFAHYINFNYEFKTFKLTSIFLGFYFVTAVQMFAHYINFTTNLKKPKKHQGPVVQS